MNRDDIIRIRAAIVEASENLQDDVASEVPFLFQVWEAGTAYSVGDRRRYGSKLYKCVQAHTSQSDWAPDVTPALWARASEPGEEWPEWVQPTGAHDAYQTGDKVSHNGSHWTSTADNNVWEPGVYGWEMS